MVVGAILQASSYTRAQMIVGRVVSGVGMGMINSTVPVIQAEFSPKSSRGICKSLARLPCFYRMRACPSFVSPLSFLMSLGL